MIEFITFLGDALYQAFCILGGYLLLFIGLAFVLYFCDSKTKHKRISVRRFNRYLVYEVLSEEKDDEGTI